ncbi:MAG: hypothetical protein IJD78_02195 [Clostridia bacterium]|nr:hypothetical protein [Clostridia bacterium]
MRKGSDDKFSNEEFGVEGPAWADGKIINEAIFCEEFLMKQPKANQVLTVKIPDDKISKYLKPTATVKEKEDFLAKAVEYYGKHLMKQKDRGAR